MTKRLLVGVVAVVVVLLVATAGAVNATSLDPGEVTMQVDANDPECGNVDVPPGWGPDEEGINGGCLFSKGTFVPLVSGDCDWLLGELPPGWGPNGDGDLMVHEHFYCRIVDLTP